MRRVDTGRGGGSLLQQCLAPPYTHRVFLRGPGGAAGPTVSPADPLRPLRPLSTRRSRAETVGTSTRRGHCSAGRVPGPHVLPPLRTGPEARGRAAGWTAPCAHPPGSGCRLLRRAAWRKARKGVSGGRATLAAGGVWLQRVFGGGQAGDRSRRDLPRPWSPDPLLSERCVYFNGQLSKLLFR